MANQEHLDKLKAFSVDVWNQWRTEVLFTPSDFSLQSGTLGERKIDLSGAVLSGADLRKIDLNKADLHRARLQRARLTGANLGEANLGEAALNHANLSKANLRGANLNFAYFTAANLRNADLHRAKLNYAYLYNAVLSEANLRGADLREADLRTANLSGANLSGANLSGANLSGANLTSADLSWANFSGANLTSADLRGADLSGANLSGANLDETILGGTIFFDTDLKGVLNLECSLHQGPSTVDHLTLEKLDVLPKNFLRGCGLPEKLIEYYPSLLNRAKFFYSCFISYSHNDKVFARRLHDQLQVRGIRCWLDEHELLPGDDIYDQVSEGIRGRDKVLLCASESALTSWWVDDEIDSAFRKEQQLMKQHGLKVLSLIPLDMDGHLFKWKNGKAGQVKSRLAADFKGWETDNAVFEAALEKIVSALQIDNVGRKARP